MSDTYKVGRGRAMKTVQAKHYTRDQDWALADWIKGPVQVYRDHFRVGPDLIRAEKGDWILQYDGKIEVQEHAEFSKTAREVPDE